MKLYQLKAEQFVRGTMDEVWDFFSSPANLKHITPSYMGFKIVSEPPGKMFTGQIIAYTVKPVLGIPMSWVTEITHVDKNKLFVDEQRFGPYSMWHHEHHFEEVDGGVMMRDLVSYVIPLGPLGRIAHALFIKKQLKGIFDFRKEFVDSKFNAATIKQLNSNS